MNFVAESDEQLIIVTGPNNEALAAFRSTLTDVAPDTKNRIKVLLNNQLLTADVDFSKRHVKCFLVMPRASRTLVYIKGDDASMSTELKHICRDENNQWSIERGKGADVTLYSQIYAYASSA